MRLPPKESIRQIMQMIEQDIVLKSLNFSYYATFGILLPFLPLYFATKGFSDPQIGILMMIGPFVMIFFQPLCGYLNDKYQTSRLIIFILWVLSAISSIGIVNTSSYLFTLLFVMLLFSFFISSSSILDTLTVNSAKLSSVSYGSIRLYGSAGYSIVAVVSGLLLHSIGGVKHIFYLYWVILLLPLGLLLFLKEKQGRGISITFYDLKTMLGNKQLLWFFFLVFVLMVPQRMNDAMLPLYLRDLGAKDAMIGWSLALVGLSEIPAFLFLSRYMHKFHELIIIGIVALFYAIRWYLYGIIADPLAVTLLQVMTGVTWAVLWIISVQYIIRIVPENLRSTGLSILTMVVLGFCGITGGIVGGWVKQTFGGAQMYFLGSLVSVVAATLILGTHACYRRKS